MKPPVEAKSRSQAARERGDDTKDRLDLPSRRKSRKPKTRTGPVPCSSNFKCTTPSDLLAIGTFKKDRKRHLTSRSRKTMASFPNSNMQAWMQTMEAGLLTGRESTASQPGDRPSVTIQEAVSQQALMLTVPPASLPLMFTPVKEGQQLLVSFSSVPSGPPNLAILCSSLIVHPSPSHGLLVIQQQATNASNQVLIPSTLSAAEWQEMVQAAEALLALRNASQTLPGPNTPGC